MTKLTILIVALAALNSCDSGSSSKAKPQTDADLIEQGQQKLDQAAPVTDVTKTIMPDRIQLVKANLSYEEKKEMQTIGCKEATGGGYKVVDYQLDSETMAGDLFREESASDNLTENSSFSRTSRTVRKIQPNFISLEYNYEVVDLSGTPFKSIDEIFKQVPHYVSEQSYTFKDEGYPNVNFGSGALDHLTPEATAYLRNDYLRNPTQWSCSLTYDSSANSSNQTDKIMYNFMGRPTEAYQEKSEVKGKVTCELRKSWNPDSTIEELKPIPKPLLKVEKGLGKRISNKVISNKYKTTDLVSCGGEELYRSELLVLDSGEIIYSRADKKLTAPIRLRQ